MPESLAWFPAQRRQACALSVATLTLVLAIVVAACSGTGGAGRAERQAAGAPERTVDVALIDYKVDMPVTIPAGTTAFRVTNKGAVEHNFEIEGPGVEEEFDQNLKPGETRTLQVNLQPGTYRVYCPVGDHAERGMTLQLTVTPER